MSYVLAYVAFLIGFFVGLGWRHATDDDDEVAPPFDIAEMSVSEACDIYGPGAVRRYVTDWIRHEQERMRDDCR